MLSVLRIENYALIEHLELEFRPGFNIITGETGAGKSILLGALGLIQGRRADPTSIMQGQERCVVEAEFDIAAYALESYFQDEDLDYSPRIVVRRMVNAQGKSRAFINDVPVTLQQLRGLTDRLLDIHSQHANLLLKDAPFQLSVVDSFAGNAPLLEEYSPIYQRWRETTREIADLRKARESQLEEADYLRFQHAELEAAHLQPGEQEALEQRQKALAHAEELQASLGLAQDILDGDGEFTVLQGLRTAMQAVRSMEELLGDEKGLAQRLESMSIDLLDLSHELRGMDAGIEANPQELEQIEARLGLIYDLERKHRCDTVEALIEAQGRLRLALENLDGSGEELHALEILEEELRGQVENLAQELRDRRVAQLQALSQEIVQRLERLGMEHARFETALYALPEYGPKGLDEVEFLFSANRQQEPAPLARIASGGEMSRVMLCLKEMMAVSERVPTLIFDEIDTGVGGAVAAQMGSILRGLGRQLQIINITHLPQIACMGDNHFLVYKEHLSEHSRTSMRLIEGEDRVREIAKMLSGADITEASYQNARELLRAAGHPQE